MSKGKLPIDANFINIVERIDAGELTQKEAAEMLNVSAPGLCKRIAKFKRQQPPASLLELSEQRQVFCIAKGAGASNKEAARLAYPDAKESSLPVLASQVLSEPMAQVAIADLMARHGIDRNFRVSRLRDCMLSSDLNVTLKALDQGWKLEGAYAAEKVEHRLSEEAIRAWIQGFQVPDDDEPEVIDITPK